jgi:hypothetical protein
MAKVIIHHAPLGMAGMMFHNKSSLPIIRQHLPDYIVAGFFETDKAGEDAAEEAYDLTNNPDRQDEREEKYGRGKSVSGGDVIEVDGVHFACMSSGWAKL